MSVCLCVCVCVRAHVCVDAYTGDGGGGGISRRAQAYSGPGRSCQRMVRGRCTPLHDVLPLSACRFVSFYVFGGAQGEGRLKCRRENPGAQLLRAT